MRIAVLRSQPLELGLPVEARLSPVIFEPGIVGLWRPVLLLPQGVIERLTPSEFEAVIAHELCHVRRRDNLFAAIHMLIESLFWFHPLVWWIGARLLEERERACDEDVVSLGNRPDVYADAILNICKLYAESPLACVSGVTGADVRRRIETIMSERKAAGLGVAKKIVLTCAAILAVAGPLSIGLLLGVGHTTHLFAQSQPAPIARQAPPPAPDSAPAARVAERARPLTVAQTKVSVNPFETPGDAPVFESVSIKPCQAAEKSFSSYTNSGGLRMNCQTLRDLIRSAYATRSAVPQQRLQIDEASGPSWVDSDRFKVQANADVDPDRKRIVVPMMLRAVLEERFHLKFHYENRQAPVYVLSVASSGLRMQPFQEGSCVPADLMLPAAPGVNYCRSRGATDGSMVSVDAQGMSIDDIRMIYLPRLNRPLIDKTGLTGRFDFHLVYAQTFSSSDAGPTIVTAMRDQLGLQIEPGYAPLRFLVLDSAERPAGN